MNAPAARPPASRLPRPEATPLLRAIRLESVPIEEIDRLLAPEEHARADKLRRPDDRRAHLAMRGALRMLLEAVTGHPAADFRFGTGAWGQPFILSPAAARDVNFSIAHSGEIGLIGILCSRRIGVDVERRRPLQDWDAIARTALPPATAERLIALGLAAGNDEFLRWWTVGEAFSKATGLGLAGLGGIFPLLPAQPTGTEMRIAGGPMPACGLHWNVVQLQLGTDYAGTAVFEGHDPQRSGLRVPPEWGLAAISTA